MNTLTRAATRKLVPGSSVSSRGVVYTRLKNGDGRWSVNVMVAGVRHHQVIGLESEGYTRTQAEDVISRIKAAKREKAHGVRKARPVSFREAGELYLQHLEATGGKDIPKKRERMRLHLYPHLGALRLATMTKTDLKRYSAAREREGAKPGTINRELAVVSHLLGLAADAEELGLLPGLPFRVSRMKEPDSKPIYLKPAESKALLTAAAEDQSEHVLAFCMIGLHTGMRRSPILRIRLDEIDLERRVLWIDRDKAGERQQPLTGELCKFLAAYTKRMAGPWLFPSARSESGHAHNIREAFQRVVAAAGLRSVITPHKMRHTMATTAAHAGVDAATLQAVGGWKSRRMVERYTHAGTMRDAMDKLAAGYSAASNSPGRKRTITQKLHGKTTKRP